MATDYVLPTDTSGEELTMCPVCFGPTILKGNSIYCPNCGIVVSENLSDTMKAKVELIKEAITIQKEAPKERVRLRHHLVANVVASVVVVIFFMVSLLFGLTGYEIVKGIAYERNGEYALAQESYTKSQWLVTFPGIVQAINRTKRLSISEQNFQQAEQYFEAKIWDNAIYYYDLVAPDDANYKRAQVSKKIAKDNLAKKP